MQLNNLPYLDALLSDISIGTSAAPTVFPAYYFKNGTDSSGNPWEFNLIDGGVAANNPVMFYETSSTEKIENLFGIQSDLVLVW
jgi:patatin-like phospholipase/acyl hydrolase